MGGRVTRYPMRGTEKTDGQGQLRDVELGHRWMDAMSVDYSCLFPTGMLYIGLHPQNEMEVELCWAYNRWLTEKVMPDSSGRFFSMLSPAVLRPRRVPAPRREVRPPQARRRLHGHDRPQQPRGQRQPLHEGLSRDRGARPGAVVPLRPELGRADLQELQPLPVGARARLHLVQHRQPVELGHQRHGRALPEAARGVDRIRPRLGAVPDAEARPRVHAAAVGGAAAQEEAVGLHARHVLLVAADGDPGHGRAGDARSA